MIMEEQKIQSSGLGLASTPVVPVLFRHLIHCTECGLRCSAKFLLSVYYLLLSLQINPH